MKAEQKKLVAFILALSMLLIGVVPVPVYADGGINIALSSDGILTWDSSDTGAAYKVLINAALNEESTSPFDIAGSCKACKYSFCNRWYY